MPDSIFTGRLGYLKSQAQQMGMAVGRYKGYRGEELVTGILFGKRQEFWRWWSNGCPTRDCV